MKNKKNNLVIYTRWYRKWHKNIGLIGLAGFLLVGITGLLLIWKKNSKGYLLSDTREGTGTIPTNWVSIDSLQKSAVAFLIQHSPGKDPAIDRVDIRPKNGIAKVAFKNHYTAIQVDLTTGKPIYLEIRRADFIEQLHDGSLFDKLAGANFIKLIYGTLLALFLLFLSFSGFFLWYNPGKIRKIKYRKFENNGP